MFLVLFAVSSLIAKGQSIFDSYANNEEVSYISINPKMFEMLGKMSVSTSDPEAEEYLKMVQSISSFKVHRKSCFARISCNINNAQCSSCIPSRQQFYCPK